MSSESFKILHNIQELLQLDGNDFAKRILTDEVAPVAWSPKQPCFASQSKFVYENDKFRYETNGWYHRSVSLRLFTGEHFSIMMTYTKRKD